MSSYYVASHTSGFRDALEAAGRMPLAGIARITGLSHPALREFYDLFQRTPSES